MADNHRRVAAPVSGSVPATAGREVCFDTLVQASRNVVTASELLNQLMADLPDTGGQAEAIGECEHRGDAFVQDLVGRLNRGLNAVIEREDLLALISALDDIVDHVDEVAAFLGLYGIEAPMAQAQALARVLLLAAQELSRAVDGAARAQEISDHVVEVHRLENEGDQIVRGAIAALFVDGVDPMVVIRWKDIFERLEDAIDATERAAYVLAGIVIKDARASM